MASIEEVEKLLKTVYPRAMSYGDIWNTILSGQNSIQRYYKSGGSTLKLLVKKGKVKQITDGFYCWIPN